MSTGMSGSGKQPERKTVFDPADRARLRAALLGYMKQHGIGVPTLQTRIAQATGRPDEDWVPQKTLQRFLADTHRTNDNFLIIIDQFVSSFPEQSPATHLGMAIAGFLNMWPEARTDLRPEPGTYTIARVVRPFDLEKPTDTPAADLISYVTLHASPYAGVLIMHEQVVSPYGAGTTRLPAGYRLNYEGTAIPGNTGFLAVLRNTLNYLPKTYMLAREGEEFMGHALTSEATLDSRPGAYVFPERYKLQRSDGAQP